MAPYQARIAAREARPRSTVEDREWAVLVWSADFADPDTAVANAERMATPWFAVNYDANRAINAETSQWRETDRAAACRGLDTPTLVIAGREDIRPYWCSDSLVEALPDSTRLVIDGAGHLPWVERPDTFAAAVREFLAT